LISATERELRENDEPVRQQIYADLNRGEPVLTKVVALRPKDDKFAAFLRARNATGRDSGPNASPAAAEHWTRAVWLGGVTCEA
jgi:hypothetical protein